LGVINLLPPLLSSRRTQACGDDCGFSDDCSHDCPYDSCDDQLDNFCAATKLSCDSLNGVWSTGSFGSNGLWTTGEYTLPQRAYRRNSGEVISPPYVLTDTLTISNAQATTASNCTVNVQRQGTPSGTGGSFSGTFPAVFTLNSDGSYTSTLWQDPSESLQIYITWTIFPSNSCLGYGTLMCGQLTSNFCYATPTYYNANCASRQCSSCTTSSCTGSSC
jgi:hypothetical protein